MNEEMKQNLKNVTSWKKICFIVLFACFYGISIIMIWIVILFQIIVTLFKGEINVRLRTFSRQLSKYIYDILLYMTFNAENRPFPFDDWPGNDEKTGG